MGPDSSMAGGEESRSLLKERLSKEKEGSRRVRTSSESPAKRKENL